MTLTEPSQTNGGGQVLQKDAATANATAATAATTSAGGTHATATPEPAHINPNTTTKATATTMATTTATTTTTAAATTTATTTTPAPDAAGGGIAAAPVAHPHNKPNIEKSGNKSTKQVSEPICEFDDLLALSSCAANFPSFGARSYCCQAIGKLFGQR